MVYLKNWREAPKTITSNYVLLTFYTKSKSSRISPCWLQATYLDKTSWQATSFSNNCCWVFFFGYCCIRRQEGIGNCHCSSWKYDYFYQQMHSPRWKKCKKRVCLSCLIKIRPCWYGWSKAKEARLQEDCPLQVVGIRMGRWKAGEYWNKFKFLPNDSWL